ncbi:hypothetical protein Dimus_023970 [Dionaea muscipula]
MADHMVVSIDCLTAPPTLQSVQGTEFLESTSDGIADHHVADLPSLDVDDEKMEEHDLSDENQPLIQVVECRICQEEDSVSNLEIPCACSGSLKLDVGSLLKNKYATCKILL